MDYTEDHSTVGTQNQTVPKTMDEHKLRKITHAIRIGETLWVNIVGRAEWQEEWQEVQF
jgi:hypothetical protein